MLQQVNTLSLEKKYELYESAVQNPASDIEFLNREYQRIYGKRPISLREDFGGTAILSCEWAKQAGECVARAIDLDPEPIQYGKNTHYAPLTDDQKSRVTYIEGNVLDDHGFKSDIIVAFNFSYYIFKKRKQLVEYFSKVREAMNERGMFVIDLFGGYEAREPMVEETEHDEFSYFWDCERYNPITQECFYGIHFKDLDTGVKYNNVFTYDWRHWNLQELREVMEDAGFSKTVAYWEGVDDDGTGDGNFYQTDFAENCESWVTYIIAMP